MNFDFNFVTSSRGSSDSSNSPSMMDGYEQRIIASHNDPASNSFDCLMNGSMVNDNSLNIDSIANDKADEISQSSR
jgi:hypothetical protein